MEEDGPEINFPLPPKDDLAQNVKDLIIQVTAEIEQGNLEKREKEEVKKNPRRSFLDKMADKIRLKRNLKTLIELLNLPVEVQETTSNGDCGPDSVVKQLRLVKDPTPDELEIINKPVRERCDAIRRKVSQRMRMGQEPWIVNYNRNFEQLNYIADPVQGGERWKSCDDMWTEMGKKFVWVEEGFWVCLAKLLGRDIFMVTLTSSPARPIQIFSGQPYAEHEMKRDKSPLYIGYIPPRHYVSLKPVLNKTPSMLDICRAFQRINRGERQMLVEAQPPQEEGDGHQGEQEGGAADGQQGGQTGEGAKGQHGGEEEEEQGGEKAEGDAR